MLKSPKSLAVNLYKCLSLPLACGYFLWVLAAVPTLCCFVTPDMSEYTSFLYPFWQEEGSIANGKIPVPNCYIIFLWYRFDLY